MKITVTKFDIINELDIVLAHRRTGQLCDLCGIGFYNKTSFITAVSEICRNVIEHAKSGKIEFNISTDGSLLEAVIKDNGKGIENVDYHLTHNCNPDSKGCGLQNAKKLVDVFSISTSDKGTTVTLSMKTNSKSVPINKTIINEWANYFKKEAPASPYEEIKRQNDQLLEITEQLRIKYMETAAQLEQIKSLNFQLNKSNKELEDFASTLSHDLRSPIANLKMLMAIMSNTDPENKFEYLDKLNNQIERVDSMILGLAQIIDLKNTQNVVATKVYFHEIFSIVREELKREIEESGCIIHTNFSKQLYINYYEVYLHSIMLNLISNAIKYRSEKPPQIDITTIKEGDKIVLKVEDNGIGMDLEKIGMHLFKPFKRFNDEQEGKGLGLHLINGMVEKNGGTIEVESQPGSGTLFKVFMVEY
ncbi:MAG TPA: sensor histidine kinase [Mariniphaga sp.]|nr:sensor histidine kinase [Mariniphaga sp.]